MSRLHELGAVVAPDVLEDAIEIGDPTLRVFSRLGWMKGLLRLPR